jgi:hypothetical protein
MGRLVGVAVGVTAIGFGIHFLILGYRPEPAQSESFSSLDLGPGYFFLVIGVIVVLVSLISLFFWLKENSSDL